MMKTNLTREQLIEIFTIAWEAKRKEIGRGIADKGTKVGAGLDAVFAELGVITHVPYVTPVYPPILPNEVDEWHTCHFCGTDTWNGYEDRMKTKRHWLSDCRPDLVEHPVGPLCTWPLMEYDGTSTWTREQTDKYNKEMGRPGCYAYQDLGSMVWTPDHIHFYPNRPM